MHHMYDHPGWGPAGTRTLRTTTAVWTATAELGITTTPNRAQAAPAPLVDIYEPEQLDHRVPAELRSSLHKHGPVARLRNPDLWDAIGTAIIRQVIRAGQARLMYQRFSAAFGESATGGPPLFPTPEAVLNLDDDAFQKLGMAFKRRPLRATAQAFTDLGTKWSALPPAVLIEEIQSIPRIGPWTAGAAVADYTGDFSYYPYGDMAVRKYARQAAPSLDLPDTEPGFANQWEGYTTTSEELSALTVLTLAMGGHREEAKPPD